MAGPDYDNSATANQARLEKAKAAEEMARTSGDNYQLRIARGMATGFAAQAAAAAVTAAGGSDVERAAASHAAAVKAEQEFITRNPSLTPTIDPRPYPITPEERQARLKETLLSGGAPRQGWINPAQPSEDDLPGEGGGGGGGGSSSSSDDMLGPDPRAVKKNITPLESLLSSIYPDAVATADPFADPRAAGGGTSVIDTILGNLGASRGSASGGSSGYVPAPSFSGPAGPSQGAQIAATIPGAPPFLANAINNVQAFNPYNQVPNQPTRGGGGGFDPLIGISAISAEQRVQKAELAKAQAAAKAKYLASQAKQEKMSAESANLARLKVSPVGQSGWSPAMPQY